MPIDFRNTNTVWASILAETLKRLGLTTAVICPGSRSTPLAVAFAQQDQMKPSPYPKGDEVSGVPFAKGFAQQSSWFMVHSNEQSTMNNERDGDDFPPQVQGDFASPSPLLEAIPVLDERSAAFFALGIARATARPVVLVCTSGTAGANFYPAVIEARESRVPLLVLTADRPPELRECHSGQTIDQQKLYGNYPNWQAELAVPSLEIGMLNYLRQTLVHAWERSLFPVPGPVHLNIPFRDPLAPLPQFDTDTLKSQFQPEDFFVHLPNSQFPIPDSQFPIPHPEWQQCEKGIIIAGLAQPQHPHDYCAAIAKLSQALGFPVLAEGLSPVRNYAELNPFLISTYDLILRNRQLAQHLTPTMVIQIGELPTSKQLRAWLDECQPQRWIIDPSHHNLDALHGKTIHLRMSVEQLTSTIPPLAKGGLEGVESSPYLDQWCAVETKVRSAVDRKMATKSQLFEGKAAWLLSQTLPAGTPLFIANSMSVRDVEFFWKPGNTGVRPYFNRGANGIDGTLSTALGIAHRNQSSVMLTGDLALLHDTNGFLLKNKFVGHLTIVLINNNGGGIFEMLPISKFEPPFEEFFATPQDVNFAQLCVTYGVEHQLIQSWEQLRQLLNPLPTKGVRVLELRTDRKADASWRQEYLGKFAAGIESV